MERAGLLERAQALIARSRQATTGRVLALYFVVRQLAAALCLTALGGHAQMVRPLVAPMAEAAAERRFGVITPATRFLIRANATAVAPLHLSVWAMPTALLALVVHVARLILLDRQLQRQAGAGVAERVP